MTHLVGDEVLTDGQRHLDGVGFVRDRDGIHLELVLSIKCVSLAHGILEHLLVAFLAQNGADVDQAWLTTATSKRAALQYSKEQHTTKLH